MHLACHYVCMVLFLFKTRRIFCNGGGFEKNRYGDKILLGGIKGLRRKVDPKNLVMMERDTMGVVEM